MTGLRATAVERPVCVDIDGTLTTTPGRPWGPPIASRLDAVRRLVAAGHRVVLWSGGGRSYAEQFAARHDLTGATLVCEGKPSLWVDDNPAVSPSMDVVAPDWLDSL